MSVSLLVIVLLVALAVVFVARSGSGRAAPPRPPPSSAAEFEVSTTTEVFDQDGTTVIGHIRPGTRYQGTRVDDRWITLPSPDGSSGYVRITDVTIPGDRG